MPVDIYTSNYFYSKSNATNTMLFNNEKPESFSNLDNKNYNLLSTNNGKYTMNNNNKKSMEDVFYMLINKGF